MKALITGGGGFLGRHLLDELAARGDEATALVRPGSGTIEELRGRGVGVLEADLRRPPEDLGSKLAGFDAIYHLAAGAGSGWRATFEGNVLATEKLVEAIEEANWQGRFVHVSSFSVYGANQLAPKSVLDESTPLEPDPGRRDDYAWTKLLQERLVSERLGGRPGVELVIVRPGAIYGRERRFQYRLGRELGAGTILLLGGGNTMPLNYVENTASLLAECGHNPAAAGEVFNAVDPGGIKQREYLRAWKRSEDIRVIPFPLWAYRLIGRTLDWLGRNSEGRTEAPLFLDPYVMEPSLRRLVYDSSRAASVLGWTPPVSSEEALARTFPPSSSS